MRVLAFMTALPRAAQQSAAVGWLMPAAQPVVGQRLAVRLARCVLGVHAASAQPRLRWR